MSEKHAIIIAVEDYQDPSIEKVKYAENDARAFATALDQHGFKKINRTCLVSYEATKARLESLLRTRIASLMEDDQLILFYAGHGFADTAKNYITS